MSQKKDRINEILAERISQLENELNAALSGKERAENETKLVKEEAYVVVAQWSAENTELRRRLSASEENHATTKAVLKNCEDTVVCLKEELAVAQKLTTQYSSTIDKLQQRSTDLSKHNEELEKDLSTAQCTIATSEEQINNLQRLVVKFETELKDLLAARGKDELIITDLRSSLASVSNENRVLRQAGEDVSCSTEKLLERVSKLKDENNSLIQLCERLSSEIKTYQMQAKKYEEDAKQQNEHIEHLSSELAATSSEIQRLNAVKEELEKKCGDTSLSLQSLEAAAANQLDLIRSMENEAQELRAANIATGKVVEDLQAELSCSKQRVEQLTREKEDLVTEFSMVKECYSSVLLEFDDHKRENARVVAAMKSEYESVEKNFSDRLSLMEQNYTTAWASVQDLTDLLQSQRCSEFTKNEQIRRQSVLLEQQISWSNILEQQRNAVSQNLYKALSTIENLEFRLHQVEQAATRDAEQLEALTTRYHAIERTLSEQRKMFSALEGQLSQSNARLKEGGIQRDALVQENEWLKTQVESMRQELGELDEILNSSLNEMREENERLQLENEEFSKKLSSLNEKDAHNADTVRKLQSNAADLESELHAQTKTLELTEAELQASKAQLENVTTSLRFLQKRAEDLDALNAELLKTNSSLSSQVRELQERVESQETKLSSILSDKRKDNEVMKAKLSTYVERCEKVDKLLRVESEAKMEAENATLAIKEQNSKLRVALDELKTRCASDAASLKKLLAERDDLISDRDIIVEKYNKLHDAFRNVRKEVHGKITDELRRVMDLAVSQEAELQTLRQQNTTLKKSVSMFVESAQPKAEAIFMERLNLTEGPLRHPKKRSTANATD